MWDHAIESIRCPRCTAAVRLDTLPASDASPRSGPAWVETGALFCDTCRVLYPIWKGVPILLTYTTPLAEMTVGSWPAATRSAWRGAGFRLPSDQAPKGEQFVGASFSTEWADYEYGATLWTAPTDDRIQTFQGECGLKKGDLKGKRFCEIGCGLGIMTNEAATTLGAEAWGMDLSSAVFRAAAQFRSNSMLHFVQASIFAPPFEPGAFGFVYSHGVLHHTWSTKAAVARAVTLVRDDGGFYVWLYGYDDVRISVTRRIAFAAEALVRPVLARLPPKMATVAQLPLIPMYQVASLLGKSSGTHGTVYSAKEALHAARDRFTPLYAHRHEVDEVAGWLKEMGFNHIHVVKENEVAPSWSLAIKRNVSVRARRN